MKKNLVLEMMFLVLVCSLIVVGCASTGASTKTASEGLSKLVGTWRGFDSYAGGIVDISSNGNGSLKMYSNGNLAFDIAVRVTQNGQLSINNKNVQYTLTDVVVQEKYLGERLTVKGFIDNDLIFYKTKPSGNISLAGTSWYFSPFGVTYIFKDDGSFTIELRPDVQAFNELQWHADTSGTYSVNGIEVLLNYPNGKGFNFSKLPNDQVGLDAVSKNSDRIFIEGRTFVLGGAVFRLVTE